MIVSTCGFGGTGSSAVNDYLQECDNTINFDAIEFDVTTMVDGLEDLEFHLMKQHSRIASGTYAIQRFKKAIVDKTREWIVNTKISAPEINRITDEFIESITQVKFVGFTPMIDKSHIEILRHYIGESIILNRLLPFLEKHRIIRKNIDVYPLGEIRASVRLTQFYVAAQKFVRSILYAMGVKWDNNQYLVLDQAFSGNDPVKSFPFFDNPYAIVVDRDPRDLYIFAKEVLLSRGRFMPTDNVKNYITYYKILREGQPYKEYNPRVLNIRFEDMVYKYEETIDIINRFLKIENKKKRSIFVPEISCVNTNLIRKFPQYIDDVKKIEHELGEYCYDFTEVGEIFPNAGYSMFFGKSPLNQGG